MIEHTALLRSILRGIDEAAAQVDVAILNSVAPDGLVAARRERAGLLRARAVVVEHIDKGTRQELGALIPKGER